MKDKWMNIGSEDDELKPYSEPEQDFIDPKRVEILLSSTGCTKEEIDESLRNKRYDDLMAYYLLLQKRTQEVRYILLINVDNLFLLLPIYALFVFIQTCVRTKYSCIFRRRKHKK